MIYAIYSCPVFCPPLYFAPYNFAPGNCFMIYTIYPCPISFCPLDSFCPHIILSPGNGLMIYTINSCPVSFCHCIRLLFHTNKKLFTTKAYGRRASGDCGTSGWFTFQLITFPMSLCYQLLWFYCFKSALSIDLVK